MTLSNAPETDNLTPFAFEPAFLTDEEGWPVFVPIIKATFALNSAGVLEIGEQRPVDFAGEYWGDPDTSSYRYEPECAFVKPSTDIVLLGHACAPRSAATEVTVGLRVGGIQKIVTVIGDRYWTRERSGIVMTPPHPFEQIPLVYERAFGGWDRQDPNRPACEPRNPVGRGFRIRWDDSETMVPLPNLEDPQQRIRSFGDRPAPAGFGFLAPHWLPRASFAGSYDAAWLEHRSPLLPVDFDRRFFNSASVGLVAPRYLEGNERVQVANVGGAGQLAFALPGVPAPRVEVTLRGSGDRMLETKLDTVIINTDERIVILVWRAHLRVSDIPRDVEAITVQ